MSRDTPLMMCTGGTRKPGRGYFTCTSRRDRSGARADDPRRFSEEWWARFTDACEAARDFDT
jgi:hypothetical protein